MAWRVVGWRGIQKGAAGFMNRRLLAVGARAYWTSIVIWRGLASSRLGNSMDNTPCLKDAAAFSAFTLDGSVSERVKFPVVIVISRTKYVRSDSGVSPWREPSTVIFTSLESQPGRAISRQNRSPSSHALQ